MTTAPPSTARMLARATLIRSLPAGVFGKLVSSTAQNDPAGAAGSVAAGGAGAPGAAFGVVGVVGVAVAADVGGAVAAGAWTLAVTLAACGVAESESLSTVAAPTIPTTRSAPVSPSNSQRIGPAGGLAVICTAPMIPFPWSQGSSACPGPKG